MELFRSAGLGAVEESVLEADVTHSRFEDWWDPFTRGAGPAGAHARSLDVERLAELRERTRALLLHAPFTIRARAWAARGTA